MEHRVLLQKCGNCGEVRFPPMPGCPKCGSPDCEPDHGERQRSGLLVDRRAPPARDASPRTTLPVHHRDGRTGRGLPRARPAATAPSSRRSTLPVTAEFVDHDDWTELAFAPAERGVSDVSTPPSPAWATPSSAPRRRSRSSNSPATPAAAAIDDAGIDRRRRRRHRQLHGDARLGADPGRRDRARAAAAALTRSTSISAARHPAISWPRRPPR